MTDKERIVVQQKEIELNGSRVICAINCNAHPFLSLNHDNQPQSCQSQPSPPSFSSGVLKVQLVNHSQAHHPAHPECWRFRQREAFLPFTASWIRSLNIKHLSPWKSQYFPVLSLFFEANVGFTALKKQWKLLCNF